MTVDLYKYDITKGLRSTEVKVGVLQTDKKKALKKKGEKLDVVTVILLNRTLCEGLFEKKDLDESQICAVPTKDKEYKLDVSNCNDFKKTRKFRKY